MTPHSRIPQVDPHAGYQAYRAEIDDAWRRVMESGRYILGPEIEAFEREFAEYLGVPFAVATASGTDSLHLALRSLEVGPGHLVLTVSHTAVATVAAIVQCGARPLFVDIDPVSYTMDPNRLHDAIRRHRDASIHAAQGILRAIVPVHLYGLPADMPAVKEIADKYDLFVVEDCAQSHGATIQGRQTGTWGDIGAFSFYPTKNLGAFGDGGMIVTRDQNLAAKCRALREYGWDHVRISRTLGMNSRLDELQAAILRVKLRHLDKDNARRWAIAAIYDRRLDKQNLVTPVTRIGSLHVYHQYAVRSPQRGLLRSELRQQGVETSIHYPLPVHQHPAFESFAGTNATLTETDRIASDVLSLPMYPQLADDQLERVVHLVNSVVAALPTDREPTGQPARLPKVV